MKDVDLVAADLTRANLSHNDLSDVILVGTERGS